MKSVYDIAVVGSGYAGSLFAMIARRLGHTVVLLERGRHPRVVIGESSTPLSNLLLEEIADRYGLPALVPLTKWGSWQRSYPELVCGLKRGFTFYHHDLRTPERDGAAAEQLLVAASPHDGIADTHWYRANVDEFLVREAQRMGVDYVDETQLESFAEVGEEAELTGFRKSVGVRYKARFVVDATGPRGFLHRALGLHEAPLPGYPATSTLYSHFSGVRRPAESRDPMLASPPYPPEDAAVHHIFDGGWIWVLRFNNGVTSAGVAANAETGERLGLRDGEEAWGRLLAKMPAVAKQFEGARAERPFTFVPRLSFRSDAMAGKRWAMLPSAAGFVDPLLSTGFPLTLLGVSRLAEIVGRCWGNEGFARELVGYAAKTDGELLATSRLLAALYANMSNFDIFRSLTLVYFAAASFSESARRLGKADHATSFLLHDKPGFGEASRGLLTRLTGNAKDSDAEAVAREVRSLIEPIDVAGLCRPSPRDFCYPVIAEDLLGAAWKLGVTRREAERMLERSGFYCAMV